MRPWTLLLPLLATLSTASQQQILSSPSFITSSYRTSHLSSSIELGGSLTRSIATYTLEKLANGQGDNWTVGIRHGGKIGGWVEATQGKGGNKKKLELIPVGEQESVPFTLSSKESKAEWSGRVGINYYRKGGFCKDDRGQQSIQSKFRAVQVHTYEAEGRRRSTKLRKPFPRFRKNSENADTRSPFCSDLIFYSLPLSPSSSDSKTTVSISTVLSHASRPQPSTLPQNAESIYMLWEGDLLSPLAGMSVEEKSQIEEVKVRVKTPTPRVLSAREPDGFNVAHTQGSAMVTFTSKGNVAELPPQVRLQTLSN